MGQFNEFVKAASKGFTVVIVLGCALFLDDTAFADGPPLAGVQTLAIDVDPIGNTATYLGAFDSCISVTSGTLTVDVVIDAIPGPTPTEPTPGEGLSAFGYDLTYDPAIVTVQSGIAAGFLLQSAAGSGTPIQFGTPAPNSSGVYSPAWADMSIRYDAGAGVLERLTLSVAGSGTTILSLASDVSGGNPAVVDSASEPYDVPTILDAVIRTDGSSCEEGGGMEPLSISVLHADGTVDNLGFPAGSEIFQLGDQTWVGYEDNEGDAFDYLLTPDPDDEVIYTSDIEAKPPVGPTPIPEATAPPPGPGPAPTPASNDPAEIADDLLDTVRQ